MNISDAVQQIIDRFEMGYVFTYDNFRELQKQQAVAKALNRLVAKGKIAKLSKGVYFKPEVTPFGVLAPKQEQVVKDLLSDNGKITGYLTGYSIYNQLGLTTQVSNAIQIGKNDIRPTFKRERYTISFVKQKNSITKKNIPLLQLLDAIRYIKKIPDTTIEQSCDRLMSIFKTLDILEISELIRLSLKYPPSTRSLLGVILDEIGYQDITAKLKASLNPLTVYKLPQVRKIFSKSDEWNII
ncbi:DUF6088 family protein [Phocoenobacter skyensis]|uniref:DUF6088 family protein n=1 Tax=Phocoenobacter skyensis TaxID=97481 RepID=A0A1H7Y7J7_9PAST|nr:DUF6088 family protein [Pasteurella skyensis]MDP8078806.1 DUF6088 family protein [Pasteurella skyensis]MDP8085868.1 DUF6088 family protein [Pasteurella skyensis]MDP8186017.1 DUF6088 family protein [Pasteurella skyensis]QLB22718.1 hypothetical protein A6B44_05640 [Pasteurella skyensis]SEM42196.1 hypothetical protein SAMN05444853_1176 [Pasteurella skyensis]